MMKLGGIERKCRVALIAIADRYSAHHCLRIGSAAKRRSRIDLTALGPHARGNRGNHHRGHFELLGTIDDTVTRGDPGKVGVDRPDRASAVLDHQEPYGPIQTCVRVCRHELEAAWIFINVGGRALAPPIPGLDEVGYFTNSSMMDVDFLPPHLIVLGGSYIGLEFAQIYRRFGSEVSVIELAPRLIAREDEDVSTGVADILRGEGIKTYVNSSISRVARQGNDIAVEITSDGMTSCVTGSHLLLAIGRRPNTDDLGLEATGIPVDERGFIKVDEQLRTDVPGIWALGDCNGRGAFTHTAYNDFEIVAGNILDDQQRRLSDRIPAYALYTDPPLGRVGMLAERDNRIAALEREVKLLRQLEV